MTDRNRLIYLPLGGAGEIGMNCYVYGYGPQGAERLIVVDAGVAFPDMDGQPGVDLILPDIEWLAQRADRIEAIFITHAHEDHVGALGHLWPRLRAPVYCRRFTAIHAMRKMEETGSDPSEVRVVGPYPEIVEAGPFRVQFAPVSHSIPEASALVIDTPEGRVVHSGDYKIDRDPVVGEPFDEEMFRDIANGGVRAFICDSTNVFSRHPGRSESQLPEPIGALIASAKGMVVATTFASNVARLKTLADAGVAQGRSICLLGRAMKRMVTAAVEAGVLTDFPRTLSPEEATEIPRENLMLIVTGSQGERRAASAALARGSYLGHELKEGDLFLFSSKTIPGNEVGVGRIQNALAEIGVEVVDEQAGFYHVSGHANRPDLEAMHDLLRPQILVPNHGEFRHLREHARLALSKGMDGIVAANGMMVELSGNAPGVVEHIDVGKTYLDGSALIGAYDGIIRDRMKLALNGIVVVALIVDEEDEILEDAWVALRGLPETGTTGGDLAAMIEDELSQALPRLKQRTIDDDDKLEEATRRLVREVCVSEIGKRPEVTVLISRLMAE
ncbi:ribonuclease J [Roseibacterium sp. SDUM158017]|uniref:ribonuclease J n=1 Tax=Roseicyclus salinarum TaxID=3036773 RepID=UPI002414EAE5|nr:ribonuclease J [Roseibacterium sp. SDUM158017]MDG4649073.1 ribonuclease J [Roseibacterium sp. SDUM158017]